MGRIPRIKNALINSREAEEGGKKRRVKKIYFRMQIAVTLSHMTLAPTESKGERVTNGRSV